jgi:hypothetical protein
MEGGAASREVLTKQIGAWGLRPGARARKHIGKGILAMTVKLAKVQAVAMYRDRTLGSLIDQERGTAMRLQFKLEDGGTGDVLVDAQELFDAVINCMLDRDTTGRQQALLDRSDNTWTGRSKESVSDWMARKRREDANAFDRKPGPPADTTSLKGGTPTPASKAPPDVQQGLRDKFLPKDDPPAEGKP